MVSGNEGDGELYKLAVSGDRSAVEALVERHHADLALYLRAKTQARAVVDDSVAETWLRFFRHLKEAADEPERSLRKPESIRFWLYRTALNALRDQFRRSSRQSDVSDRVTGEASARGELAFEPDELAGLENEDRRSALRDGFARLSERCRELLSLMLVDPPLSYGEISEMLDRPIGSLGPTRQRCLGELRRHMGVVA